MTPASRERAVVGSKLLSSSAATLVAGEVRAEDFGDPGLRVIFDALCEVVGRGEYPEAGAVLRELRRRGQLEAAGGELAGLEIPFAPHPALDEALADLSRTLGEIPPVDQEPPASRLLGAAPT